MQVAWNRANAARKVTEINKKTKQKKKQAMTFKVHCYLTLTGYDVVLVSKNNNF